MTERLTIPDGGKLRNPDDPHDSAAGLTWLIMMSPPWPVGAVSWIRAYSYIIALIRAYSRPIRPPNTNKHEYVRIRLPFFGLFCPTFLSQAEGLGVLRLP